MVRSWFRVLAALAALGVVNGCGTAASTSLNPNSASTSRCGVAAAAQPTSVGAPGGAGAIAVSTDRECAWEARSESEWLSLGQSRTGQGDGTVSWVAAANPVVSERRGVVVVNGVRVEIGQAAAACTFGLDAVRASVTAEGGRQNVTVAAQPGCAWSARSDAPWLTIVSGASGNGAGTLIVAVAANATPEPRSGTLTVAGLTYIVEQAGLPPGAGNPPVPPSDPTCRFTVTPASGSFTADEGVFEVAVTASAPTCVWTAQSAAPWIALVGGVTETGNGGRRFRIAANTTSAARTGSINVAGAVITITQAAAATAPPSPEPPPSPPPPPPQPPSPPPPSPAPCTFGVVPTAAAFPAEGGAGEIAVTASAPTCVWVSQSGVPWISIQGANGGTGAGALRYTVAANPDRTPRQGTLTVAGRVVEVTQAAAAAPPPTPPPPPPAAPCTFTIAPATASSPAEGGGGQITIAASAATCDWTAQSGVPWITIAATGGTGSGAVRYTVGANPDQTPRSGTLTVAGQVVTITQAAAPAPPPPCTFTVAPASTSIPVEGGAGSVTVTASAPACTWRATTTDQWITVSAESRTGSGQVAFTVAANPSADARTGRLTIAGQPVTVSQAGTPDPGREVTLNGRISGVAGSCPNLTFTISDTTVVVNAATEYRANESCQELRNGRNARVRGRVQPNGSIIAERVENVSGGGGE